MLAKDIPKMQAWSEVLDSEEGQKFLAIIAPEKTEKPNEEALIKYLDNG